jgi:hypothetical protein
VQDGPLYNPESRELKTNFFALDRPSTHRLSIERDSRLSAFSGSLKRKRNV